MSAKLRKEKDKFFFIAMNSLDTEMLCNKCKLAVVSDMQIKDYFDRCIFLFIVTTTSMT